MPETGERGKIIEWLLVAEARLPDKLDLRFVQESCAFIRIDQLLYTAEDQINRAICAIEEDIARARRFSRKIEYVCQIPATQMKTADMRIKDYQRWSKNNLNESNLKKLITAYNQIILYLQSLEAKKKIKKAQGSKPEHPGKITISISSIF